MYPKQNLNGRRHFVDSVVLALLTVISSRLVNRGLNCVKGYFLSKIMYGKDRLTQPMLRMKGGKYGKNSEFAPITREQAFDIMAEKWKATLNAKGPEAIGMFGSGQWTVYEGYVASKLMKAGFRSNNIEPNALR